MRIVANDLNQQQDKEDNNMTREKALLKAFKAFNDVLDISMELSRDSNGEVIIPNGEERQVQIYMDRLVKAFKEVLDSPYESDVKKAKELYE